MPNNRSLDKMSTNQAPCEPEQALSSNTGHTPPNPHPPTAAHSPLANRLSLAPPPSIGGIQAQPSLSPGRKSAQKEFRKILAAAFDEIVACHTKILTTTRELLAWRKIGSKNPSDLISNYEETQKDYTRRIVALKSQMENMDRLVKKIQVLFLELKDKDSTYPGEELVNKLMSPMYTDKSIARDMRILLDRWEEIEIAMDGLQRYFDQVFSGRGGNADVGVASQVGGHTK